MKTIFKTLFYTWVLCVCLREAHAASIPTPKWMSPCGPPPLTETSGTSQKTISLQTAYSWLYENAVKFHNDVSTLLLKYIPPQGARITGDSLISLLKSVQLPGLNLPQNKYNVTNVTQDLLLDYEHLSRIAVFVEQVSVDEKYYDYGEYSSFIETTEHALYLHLCNLQIVIHSVDSTISDYVKRDVMDDSLRHLTKRSERYMRDYVVFHTAKNFGKHLEEKYEDLYKKLRDDGN